MPNAVSTGSPLSRTEMDTSHHHEAGVSNSGAPHAFSGHANDSSIHVSYMSASPVSTSKRTSSQKLASSIDEIRSRYARLQHENEKLERAVDKLGEHVARASPASSPVPEYRNTSSTSLGQQQTSQVVHAGAFQHSFGNLSQAPQQDGSAGEKSILHGLGMSALRTDNMGVGQNGSIGDAASVQGSDAPITVPQSPNKYSSFYLEHQRQQQQQLELKQEQQQHHPHRRLSPARARRAEAPMLQENPDVAALIAEREALRVSLDARTRDAQAHIDSLKLEVKRLEEQANAAESSRESAKDLIGQTIAEKNEKILKSEWVIERMKLEQEAQTTALNAAIAEKRSLDQLISQLRESLERLETESNAKVKSLQMINETLKDEMQGVVAERDDLAHQVSVIRNTGGDKDDELIQLRRDLLVTERERDNLREDIKLLKQEQSSFYAVKHLSNVMDVDSFRDDLKKSSEETKQLEADMNEVIAQQASALKREEERSTQLAANVEALRDENWKLKDDIESLKRKMSEVDGEKRLFEEKWNMFAQGKNVHGIGGNISSGDDPAALQIEKIEKEALHSMLIKQQAEFQMQMSQLRQALEATEAQLKMKRSSVSGIPPLETESSALEMRKLKDELMERHHNETRLRHEMDSREKQHEIDISAWANEVKELKQQLAKASVEQERMARLAGDLNAPLGRENSGITRVIVTSGTPVQPSKPLPETEEDVVAKDFEKLKGDMQAYKQQLLIADGGGGDGVRQDSVALSAASGVGAATGKEQELSDGLMQVELADLKTRVQMLTAENKTLREVADRTLPRKEAIEPVSPSTLRSPIRFEDLERRCMALQDENDQLKLQLSEMEQKVLSAEENSRTPSRGRGSSVEVEEVREKLAQLEHVQEVTKDSLKRVSKDARSLSQKLLKKGGFMNKKKIPRPDLSREAASLEKKLFEMSNLQGQTWNGPKQIEEPSDGEA